jgi:multidrug resistance efflux pump
VFSYDYLVLHALGTYFLQARLAEDQQRKESWENATADREAAVAAAERQLDDIRRDLDARSAMVLKREGIMADRERVRTGVSVAAILCGVKRR